MVNSIQIEKVLSIYEHEEKCAELACLIHTNDQAPGFTRQKRGKGFSFLDLKGRVVKNKKRIDRIKKLRIPPAWKEVWISPFPNTHIQACGRDEKSRKQYIYHPKWNEIRNKLNFYRLLLFGPALNKIRKHVTIDLREKPLSKKHALATSVKFLEKTLIRIGNDQYAKDNKTYGLTTIKDKHVDIEENKIKLEFTGKSHKDQTAEIRDANLAELIEEYLDVPGKEVFKYFDEKGVQRDLTSGDVNQYLKEVAGYKLTAKDFRTWFGTLEAFEYLKDEGLQSSKKTKKVVIHAIEYVAEKLGNTKAIAKGHYIHPEIIEAYIEDDFKKVVKEAEKVKLPEKYSFLKKAEVLLLKILFVLFLKEKDLQMFSL